MHGDVSRSWVSVPLGNSDLRELVAQTQRGRPAPAGVHLTADGSVRVEISHGLAPDRLRAVLGKVGARNVRSVDGELSEASVPIGRLEELEATPGIRFLRPPLIASAPAERADSERGTAVGGEEVQKTNAWTWHRVGSTGKGVRVGVIDGWGQRELAVAIGAKEVPVPAGTFCVEYGVICNFAAQAPSKHGVGVAEIIHEMAPDAQLYFASTGASSAADLQSSVDYFASQGVKVISRSQTGEYDGPGNGTGPTDSVVDNAVARGMLWVNSAGNSAGGGNDPGAYWRGSWYDPDADGWLNFAGGDELLDFDCAFVNGLRWSDWGSARTDYDLFVYDDPGVSVLKVSSEDDQAGGLPPLEHVNNGLRCDRNDIDYMAIKLYAVGGGVTGDVLEIMTNGSFVQYWTNPYSATQPASDTASAGGLSVGAVDPPLGAEIATYSSQGPTNDGRLKPDLSAASCVRSFIYSPGCFNGTSAAAPVVAGAAALVVGAAPRWTPTEVKSYLLRAVVDRGAPGPDFAFGVGELVLPAQADRVRPKARAYAARGRYGRTVRLRYKVSDNSGRSRERILIYGRGRRMRSITTPLSETGTYYVRWRAPSSGKGFRFCVRSFDPSGNASRPSCAPIRLR
jgi:subtilisin family serine protease